MTIDIGHYEHMIERRDAILSTARVSATARARIMGRPAYPGVITYTPPPKPLAAADIPIAPRSERQHVARGNVRDILNTVAEKWRVSAHAMLGPSKSPCFSRPRFAAALLMKDRMLLSNRLISYHFGRESEASGWDMVKRGRHLLAMDPEWAALYRAAKHALDQK